MVCVLFWEVRSLAGWQAAGPSGLPQPLCRWGAREMLPNAQMEKLNQTAAFGNI